MGEKLFDYEAIKKRLYQENLEEVIRAAQDPVESWLDFKVKSFCVTFEFEYDAIINLLRQNVYFAAHFIKDPGRQNFYENQALEYLRSYSIFDTVVKLPASGNDSLLIINGRLFRRSEIQNAENHKTIDFHAITNDINLYIAHKYTAEAGGAQDNQYNDLINFITQANQYIGDDYFIALADGNYYKDLTTNLNGKRVNKLEYLKHIANKQHVFASDINNLQSVIDEILLTVR
jgi:hypothetical protein